MRDKLNLLLVTPRSPELPYLDDAEAQAIRRGAKVAEEKGLISIKELKVSSFAAMKSYLSNVGVAEVPHIIHFDGHGTFGRRCPACGDITTSKRAEMCRKSGCERTLADLKPQGYLVFEGTPKYVSANEFADLLRQVGGTSLVVLSACRSAVARGGESVFNGVAQRLMDANVPAVVAMQFSILANKATEFADTFYSHLAGQDPLVTAVSWGRTFLGREGNQWYRPVLYLRSDRNNPEGCLFVKAGFDATSTDQVGIRPDQRVAKLFETAELVPEAHISVERAKTVLEFKCRSIKLLADYKEIHDYLQDLEDKYWLVHVEIYDENCKELPSEKLNWNHIFPACNALSMAIVKLCSKVESTSFGEDAGDWIASLRRASGNLHTAFESEDVRLLRDSMNNVYDVINFRISDINSELIGTAKSLDLPELGQHLLEVYAKVQTHGGGELIRGLENIPEIISALDSIATRLSGFCKEHNAWQHLDDLLRSQIFLLYASISAVSFKRFWEASLRRQLMKLCDPHETGWARILQGQVKNVDKELAEGSLFNVRMALSNCRSAATVRFVEVNTNLKALCSELGTTRGWVEKALEKLT